MSEARINRISNEKGDGGPSLSGITTFSGLNYFVPPKGTTAERPSDCPPGSIRFNTDSAHLEYWDGLQWLEFEATNEELGNQLVTNSAGGTGHRGVIVGGREAAPAFSSLIEYITISTLGNAQDFGNLTRQVGRGGALSSSTRGVFIGGQQPSPVYSAEIDYITLSSTGNAIDFGVNLPTALHSPFTCSNSTRGVVAGGLEPGNYLTAIEYITIASTGTISDFGNISTGRSRGTACSSSVRGVFAGGEITPTPSNVTNIVEYITISSTGNSQDFGDLSLERRYLTSVSSSTRGVFAGGWKPTPGEIDIIDYITIATTGNAQDFGDIISAKQDLKGIGSPVRGVFCAGFDSPAISGSMEYITIATTGDSIDFGDCTARDETNDGCSNGHGGL